MKTRLFLCSRAAAVIVTGAMVVCLFYCSTTATEGTLTFEFETVSYGGPFAPANAGVAWVKNNKGEQVKTLSLWGTRWAPHLRTWQHASPADPPDAVTEATYHAHSKHEVEWDCTDAKGRVVPNGFYHVCVEFTEENASSPDRITGRLMCAGFRKGVRSLVQTPPDDAYFKNIRLEYLSISPW